MERELEICRELERAYKNMVLALEGAIAEFLAALKEAKEDNSFRGTKVPEVVLPIFRRALQRKVTRVFKEAYFPPLGRLIVAIQGREPHIRFGNGKERQLSEKTAAHSLAHDVDYSPELVFAMVKALEDTASELRRAKEEAWQLALRIGQRCLKREAMTELQRRATLKQMENL